MKGFFVILIVGLFLAACTKVNKPGSGINIDDSLATSQALKKFSSSDELMKFLDTAKVQQPYYGNRGGVFMGLAEKSLSAASPGGMSDTNAIYSSDFSTTNVQVEGVDEADFVKNDGKYIYVVEQNKLVIVDAYPANDASIISKTEIKGQVQNMLVNENRLVLFTVDSEKGYSIPQYDFMPREIYLQKTHAIVYDITDKKNPKAAEDYSINGYYFESRMIGDYIYFIVKDGVNYYNNWINTPVVKDIANKVASLPIYYFDNPEYNYEFNTVAAFNIKEGNLDAKTFMMGYSDTLYVSKDNIYIAYKKNMPYIYYMDQNENKFFEVVVPLLPDEVQSKIKIIKNDDSLSSSQKGTKISGILEDMYNNMDENAKNNLIKNIETAVEEYDIKQEQERRKTIIHKISIDKGKIEYKAKGEISGDLLNQFSMDEDNGNLRVATTTYVYVGKSTMYNNVYVLDEGMNIAGKLEDIAPDERIYSTRFIGNRLYMVTFKRIDPLFVIGLENPEKPEILGELKIPGYSDYLHAYDENHIIGIGKETEGNEWGGVSVKGVKLALFDVSDVKNPKQLDKYEIGDAGSDSEALNDHKAFLFDKSKNILVIPVRETKGRSYNEKYGYYDWNVWQGAYVFGVTPDSGFEVKGRITHNEGKTNDYWNDPNAVRRSLYIDDTLYTISNKMIKMNDLNNIDKEINKVELPFKGYEYPEYPIPMSGVETMPMIK